MNHYNCPKLKERRDDYIERYTNLLDALKREETKVLEKKRNELRPRNLFDYFRIERMSEYKMIERVLDERAKYGK